MGRQLALPALHLRKLVECVAQFATKDGPYLSKEVYEHAKLTFEGHEWTITTADGFVVQELSVAVPYSAREGSRESGSDEPLALTVPVFEWLALLKKRKVGVGNNTQKAVSIDLNLDSIHGLRMSASDGLSTEEIGRLPASGMQFPRYSQIFESHEIGSAKEAEHNDHISFPPERLVKVAKAADILEAKHLRFYLFDRTKPARFEYESDAAPFDFWAKGLLMPTLYTNWA